MAVNSPSSSNDSLLHPDIPLDIYCYITRPSSLIMTSFFITSILLLLPLCILVIYLGLQRWRQQRSTSAAAAMMSHSDSFTYHMVAMEMIAVFGCPLCCSFYGDVNVNKFLVGYYIWNFTWYGETFFHILTCVEHYLAVVHPVTYLSLRGERGIRIRNISIGCVWLLSFGITCLAAFEDFPFFDICLLLVAVIIISFCSLSVLLVLIRPGPGEQGGDRGRVDQSKRRAFSTVLAILGMLLLRCCGNVAWCVLFMLTDSIGCTMSVFAIWFNLPCSLVLPLLFLHRAGILACCKKSTR